MNLLVVRHAIAAEREDWAASGRPDDERPLVPRGRSRMKRGAAGIASLLPHLDLIGTSALPRAAETASILASAYARVRSVELPSLAPGGSRDETVEWLATLGDAAVAVVGHEPDLGSLVGFLLTGTASTALPMRKGGACLLRLPHGIVPGRAELRWFLPPSVLRRIAT